MATLNISTLVPGNRVSIRHHETSQGVYVVAKANKMKVVLKRESDGYERHWSVKRDTELATEGRKYVDRYTWLETVEDMEARNVARIRETARRNAWADVEKAAAGHSMPRLELALEALKALTA
jgi:hypothetical protein